MPIKKPKTDTIELKDINYPKGMNDETKLVVELVQSNLRLLHQNFNSNINQVIYMLSETDEKVQATFNKASETNGKVAAQEKRIHDLESEHKNCKISELEEKLKQIEKETSEAVARTRYKKWYYAWLTLQAILTIASILGVLKGLKMLLELLPKI